jgi:Recombination endonuclease VII
VIKICGKCKEQKPTSMFYKNSMGKEGFRSDCKKCNDTKAKEYYRVHKEEYKVRSIDWHINNPDKLKNARLKKTYGIGLKDYIIMYERQNKRCKICLKLDTGSVTKSRLCVDHCHITGKIRGLLCDKCNKGLGLFNDNAELLTTALRYINET